MSLLDLVKKFEKLASDNSPLILTAIGVTGTVTTAYLTGRASFKAATIIADYEEQIKEGQRANLIPDFSTKEKIRATWQLFIPAVGTGLITVGCIIVANRIGTRRAAAMAAAFSISEKAFSEYREKVVEKLGDSKEERLRDEIAQERITKNPVSTREVIIATGGDVLCYDSITGRYFNSDMETLRKAQNDLNHQILTDFYASLNDFYGLIKLPSTLYANEVGWNVDTQLEIQFSTVLSEDGRPCISLDYKVFPIRDYFRVQ